MISPFHPTPGGVVSFGGWGPASPHPDEPAVAVRLAHVLAYLTTNGATGPTLIMQVLGWPGQPPSPPYRYLIFSKPGFEDVVAELGGMLRAPHATLGSLMVVHHFGNPFSVPMFREPFTPALPDPQGAPRPADPVGEPMDRAPGRYHSLPGDDWAPFERFTKTDGRVFEKRGYRTAFGWFVWWERTS